MQILEALRIALEMLRLHKLRAFLTMLGVIIGVMSVTIIVMVSSGFQSFMASEFKKLGADTIIITYDNWGYQGERVGSIDGLTMADVSYLKNRVQNIDIMAPIVQVPTKEVVRGTRTIDNARIFASTEDFLTLNRVTMERGRSLSESDLINRTNVVLIGPEIEERLFPDGNALGKFIDVPGITLEVIGVFGQLDFMGETNAKDMVIPLTTVQDKWLGGDNLMMITTRPKEGTSVDRAMQEIWEALMLKSGNKRIYRVDSRESIMNIFGNVFGAAGAILAAIAALSLLVGGIGIMNIMLVSVTERTKEIGLRKAVGATRSAVMGQFLIEAATLSLIGGLIGMSLAFLIGQGVTFATAMQNWPTASGLPTPFPLWAAVGAAIFSAVIGVVFGLFPAMSAAKLTPIEALRSE